MRWFYTDPLAAAWMAKHFGMKFEHHELRQEQHDEDFIGRQDYSDFFFVTMGLHNVLDAGEEKFVVARESLGLLEVAVGDMVLDSDGINGIAVLLPLQLEQCRGAIIERKGIPFMWPESEDA